MVTEMVTRPEMTLKETHGARTPNRRFSIRVISGLSCFAPCFAPRPRNSRATSVFPKYQSRLEDVKKSIFSFRLIITWKNIAPGCLLSDC